jgi:hypothetical protein
MKSPLKTISSQGSCKESRRENEKLDEKITASENKQTFSREILDDEVKCQRIFLRNSQVKVNM